MGVIRSYFKYSTVEDIIKSITAETSNYYAFASGATLRTGNTPPTTADDQTFAHDNNWELLFGKKIANNDIVPMIKRIDWAANTSYDQYDNNIDLTDKNFYVIVPPGIDGGYYHVYKCIDNANGAKSTISPNIQEPQTFQLSDGYSWRYMFSISHSNFAKFATDDYVPVYPNNEITTGASTYAGIDSVKIVNGGIGYATYHSGKIQSVSNSTTLRIESSASTLDNFYTNSAIYINTNTASTSQLRNISQYISNTTGRWVTVSEELNSEFIDPTITDYVISPRVEFSTDGLENPRAYAVINSTSNSIHDIIVIRTGEDISRATATIVANSSYGSGANLVCVVPPPGGHGSLPFDELLGSGVGITFSFVKTEGNTIPIANVTYNTIGLYKNPYEISNTGGKSTVLFTQRTFDQRTKMDLNPDLVDTFDEDEIIIGTTTNSRAKVVFSNTSQIYTVGDKTFANGETIVSTSSSKTTTINVTHRGHIYAKDLIPLYTDNIPDVARTTDQSETFRIVIEI